jgi:hypothetical protein
VAIVGSTIYAARLDGVGVSTDGGSTWTVLTKTSGLASTTLYGVSVSGSTVYAATDSGLSISQ